MPKKIFISHASVDIALVKSFVELLNSGADIRKADIFCSSIKGMGIPAGKKFIEYIRTELNSNDVVIPIISKNYFNSQVCLCELGAAWVKATNILPVIVEPCSFKDIDGVIHGIQAIKINDKIDLDEFIKSLNDIISNEDFNMSLWDAQKELFIEELETILPALPKPEQYSKEEYNEIKEKLDKSTDAVKKLLKKTSEQEEIIQELSEAKDKDDCNKIILSHLPENEQFEHLLDETKRILHSNDTVVNYALYLEHSQGDSIVISNSFEQKELSKEAIDATQNKYLNQDDNEFTLNLEDPSIQESEKQIELLGKFIEEELPDESYNEFIKEYKFKPDITNKRFWVEVLDININRY